MWQLGSRERGTASLAGVNGYWESLAKHADKTRAGANEADQPFTPGAAGFLLFEGNTE